MKTISILHVETGATLGTVSAIHGPDTIAIKRLGWRKLEEAEKAQHRSAMQYVRDLGGPAIVKEIEDARKKDTGDALATIANPIAPYDKRVLLLSGVVAIDGASKTEDQIDEWEPETATAVVTAIVRLSRPGLFEGEPERKND